MNFTKTISAKAMTMRSAGRIMTSTIRTASLFILIACAAWADGIGFSGDRVVDQKTTVLVLTSTQQAAVVSAKLTADNLCSIALTSAQQAQLIAEAGFAPANLCVRSLAAVKDHCTCEELNLGILFKADKVEIPHLLLGADLNDRGKDRLRRLKENKGASTNGVTGQAAPLPIEGKTLAKERK